MTVFLYWWKHGRDPEGKGVIMPIYKVPKNLKPGEVGVLIDERAHLHDITATIIDLAVKGYLKIRRNEMLNNQTTVKQKEYAHSVSKLFDNIRKHCP